MRRAVKTSGVPVIWLLQTYRRVLSPLFAPRCKYYPSCSAYAVDAVRELGVVRGTLLAMWRLLRCHPWSDGGVDHVCDRRLFTERDRVAPASKAGAK